MVTWSEVFSFIMVVVALLTYVDNRRPKNGPPKNSGDDQTIEK